MKSNNLKKYFTKIIFTERQIAHKVKKMAKWVDNTYADSDNLVLVGLLKGSVPFMTQLMKCMQKEHTIDFMTVSSFNGAVNSSNKINVIMDLKQDIKGKDVLVVEDIVDTGQTLTKIIDILKKRKPKSLRVITFLDKCDGRKVKFEVDKFGFLAPNEFLVGYGLDIKEKLRNVPFIGIFDLSKIGEL